MRGREITKELAATLLVESLFTTDAAVCAKYGVGVRTLPRLRVKLAEDAELADLVHTKTKALETAWVGKLGPALIIGLDTIQACFTACAADPRSLKNPLLIEKLTLALRTVAEVEVTNRLVDAKLEALRRAALPANPTSRGLLGQGDTQSAPAFAN